MNYKFCELYNKYTILTNTNKITFHSNSFFFACFSIALECCKYAGMRFHCATVLVVLSICALRGNIADDAMQMDVQNSLSFLHYKGNAPCYGNNHKKRFVGSNSQVYYYYDNLHSRLSADFQHRAFFSNKHCHDLQRKKHWLAMVFNENTNYDFN